LFILPPGVEERIILKGISKNWMEVWAGLIWLRIVGSLVHSSPRSRREDNIKMEIQEWDGGMGWIMWLRMDTDGGLL
jgi:hypothetical protein